MSRAPVLVSWTPDRVSLARRYERPGAGLLGSMAMIESGKRDRLFGAGATARRAAFAALLCAAVAALAAAPAGAATKKYRGSVEQDPKASVLVKVKRTEGRRTVELFRVEQLKLRCEDGVKARLPSAELSGSAEVNPDGRFLLSGRTRGEALRIEGRVRRGGRITGTLRYAGTAEFEDGTRECRTGKREWKAKR